MGRNSVVALWISSLFYFLLVIFTLHFRIVLEPVFSFVWLRSFHFQLCILPAFIFVFSFRCLRFYCFVCCCLFRRVQSLFLFISHQFAYTPISTYSNSINVVAFCASLSGAPLFANFSQQLCGVSSQQLFLPVSSSHDNAHTHTRKAVTHTHTHLKWLIQAPIDRGSYLKFRGQIAVSRFFLKEFADN